MCFWSDYIEYSPFDDRNGNLLKNKVNAVNKSISNVSQPVFANQN